MEDLNFYKLLLRTAFSCMACDGDIDKREVKMIKKLHKESKTFGEIDINAELDTLQLAINNDGYQFLKGYFNELSTTELTEANELKLIEVAIDTIKADNRIDYSEIKFFKVIRSKLKISNEQILLKHPDFEEYLEQDIISDSYLAKLQDDFFDFHTLRKLDLVGGLSDEVWNSFKNKTEIWE